MAFRGILQMLFQLYEGYFLLFNIVIHVKNVTDRNGISPIKVRIIKQLGRM